jgi:hypothetical protein
MADFLTGGVRAGHRCYCMITRDKRQRIAAAVSGRNERAAADAASEDQGAQTWTCIRARTYN